MSCYLSKMAFRLWVTIKTEMKHFLHYDFIDDNGIMTDLSLWICIYDEYFESAKLDLNIQYWFLYLSTLSLTFELLPQTSQRTSFIFQNTPY